MVISPAILSPSGTLSPNTTKPHQPILYNISKREGQKASPDPSFVAESLYNPNPAGYNISFKLPTPKS